MMELLRRWLVGVTCAAMIIALADSLTPSGTVRKVGKLVGGLVLLLAVLQPVLTFDYSAMAIAATDYQAAFGSYDLELEETNLDLMKTIIAERTGAYILDKAEAFGAHLERVTVTCRVGTGDMPYPAAVVITGTLDEAQRRTLTRQIEADLAIPADRQTYESGDLE